MNWLRQLRFRIRGLLRRKQLEADMAEEIRTHLEIEAEVRRAEGVDEQEARYAAQRAFGGAEQIKERCRDETGLVWLEQFFQDLRYAARSLRRNPGFTATVILTLTLGIGANATIFSVVNTVLLEPLPFTDIDRLVSLNETRPEAGGAGNRVSVPVSPATFFDWRNEVRSLDQIAAVAPGEYTFSGPAEPEQIVGAAISSNLFSMLGVVPMLGRHFLPEENRPGAGNVALLSHGFWQRRFESNPAIIGQAITLDGRRCTIVGVLPASFDHATSAAVTRGRPMEVWTPLALVEARAMRAVPAFDVHGRLAPGATLADVQREIDAVMARLAIEFPVTNAARGAKAQPLVDRVVGNVRLTLWLLLAAVGVVLLIASANIANLLLARASLRHAETAMRAALGASQSRLIRQFLTESLLLACVGCACGLLAAVASLEALVPLLPPDLPRATRVAIDGRVLAFTAIVSLLTGVIFGLAPAWHSAKTDLQAAIQTAGRGLGGVAGVRIRNALVVLQVGLSLVLLVGAGLLLKSFATLSNVDPGFDPDNVLTLRVTLPGAKYQTLASQSTLLERLVQQIETVPGVQAATMVFPLPFSGPIQNRPFTIPGRPSDPEQELSTQYNIIGVDYFRTLGIRPLQGRVFNERDRLGAPLVAMINDTTARRLWPGENPIGKRISVGLNRQAPAEREIVGVFAEIKQRRLDAEPLLQICTPVLQEPLRAMFFAVRGKVAATTLLPAIREIIAAEDKEVSVSDVALMIERVSGSVAQRRFAMWLLATFAATALLLAIVGLYGVISYAVAQRTREFGIRMALGAKMSDVLQLVVGQGTKLVVVGLIVGIVVSLGSTRVLAGLLYSVRPTDPLIFVAVSLLLGIVGVLACVLPARRAAKIDPIVALRND